MEGEGGDPLSWSLLSNSDACRSKRKSDLCVQRQIYRLRKPRLRNVARAWKKISKKKKGGGWENGSERDRPEDHDTQTKTSPSAESARAGNSSFNKSSPPMPCHAAMPRPEGGSYFQSRLQSATAAVLNAWRHALPKSDLEGSSRMHEIVNLKGGQIQSLL